MIDSNKNEELKRNHEKYKAMLPIVCQKIYKDGHAFDKWFNDLKDTDKQNYFPLDTLEDNKTIVEKKCSDDSYHQQRAMLMNWMPILSNVKRLEMQCKQRVRDTLLKKHRMLLAQFDLNEAAGTKLQSNLTTGQSLSDCTIDHFLKGVDPVKKEELTAFIWLCQTKNLDKPESPYPSYNRGMTRTVTNGESGPLLYKEAWKVRHILPTTIHPPEPEIPCTENHIPSTPPLMIHLGAIRCIRNLNNPWSPPSNFVDKSFECLTHLIIQSDEANSWKVDASKVATLNDDSLRKIIVTRLSTHLASHNQNILTPLWQWVYQHLGIGSAILKMNGMVKNDATLAKCDGDDDLYHPQYVNNHKMFTTETKTHHGSYLAFDKNRGYFVRAGSAAIGCRERTDFGHPKGSKQSTSNGQRNRFYSCYPDKTSEHIVEEIRQGWFTDIQFSPGIVFSEGMKGKVQDLFQWDGEITAYLITRLGGSTAQNLSHKKHRMVCYFFETILELCLAPKHNVSTSLGFEAFTVKINQAYGDEWLEHINGNSVGDSNDEIIME